MHAETARLLEITYELDLAPLDGRPAPKRADGSEVPYGYFLCESGPGQPATLFPATGADKPTNIEDGLLLALRYVSYFDGPEEGDRILRTVKLPYSPDFGTPSGVAPMFDFSLVEISAGVVAIAFSDLARELETGGPVVVAKVEKTLSREEFTDAVLAAYVDAGVPSPPSRDAIMQQALALASGQENITFYARLTAQDHGYVELSDIDLAVLWRDAQLLARDGPYDQAITALESLLDILPDHISASRLFHRMLDMLETGAVPAKLTASLDFPAGQPDADMRAIWEASNEGFAMLVPTNASSSAAQIAIPVRDGGFGANLYSGEWSLSISIPGFATYETRIVLKEDKVINVPLVLGE